MASIIAAGGVIRLMMMIGILIVQGPKSKTKGLLEKRVVAKNTQNTMIIEIETLQADHLITGRRRTIQMPEERKNGGNE